MLSNQMLVVPMLACLLSGQPMQLICSLWHILPPDCHFCCFVYFSHCLFYGYCHILIPCHFFCLLFTIFSLLNTPFLGLPYVNLPSFSIIKSALCETLTACNIISIGGRQHYWLLQIMSFIKCILPDYGSD